MVQVQPVEVKEPLYVVDVSQALEKWVNRVYELELEIQKYLGKQPVKLEVKQDIKHEEKINYVNDDSKIRELEGEMNTAYEQVEQQIKRLSKY
jgi:hypothetical protein